MNYSSIYEKSKFATVGLLLWVMLWLFQEISTAQTPNPYKIKQSDDTHITLVFTTGKMETARIKTETGIYSKITINGYCPSSETGKPELPVWVKLLEIPLCENIVITTYPGNYREYNAVDLGIGEQIYPVQPSYSKSQTTPIEFVKDETVYAKDEFYALDLVRAQKTGVMRHVNMATIYYAPVQYNPVTRKIRIYESAEVEIHYQNPDLQATWRMESLHSNNAFSSIDNRIANPAVALRTKRAFTSQPVKYLIVAHSLFRGSLDRFIAWKKRKGFMVDVGYTDMSNVGTTTASIQNFIKSQYTNATTQNPAPTFVLLVGDVQQIPAFNDGRGHVTDLPYMCWTDGDNIPDCYYGRFSAQNVSQLTPQIDKTLMYEQYTMPETNYLNNAALISGSDNGIMNSNQLKSDGLIRYLNNNYINTTKGYSQVYLHLFSNETQGSTIRNEIGQGVGFATYSAHCNSSGWANPKFQIGHIAQMQNQNKYGLMIGNCCSSNQFDVDECFGEKLLRTANKGAVGYIGASDLTYWSEDYYWAVGARASFAANPVYENGNQGAYDRLFHTHGEPYEDWKQTNGAIIFAGNLAVEASTSTLKNYYWEVYNLMGDPSVMTWFKEPKPLLVFTDNTLPAGATSLDVYATPYAYVALTKNNATELIVAGFADDLGYISLQFGNITSGIYELAASAQNQITSFVPITVVNLTGSFVSISSLKSVGNANLNYGDTAYLEISLTNWGIAQADSISVKLSTTSPYVTFLQDTFFMENIAAGSDTLIVPIPIKIANNVPDEQFASINSVVWFDDQRVDKTFYLIFRAPKFADKLVSLLSSTSGSDNINPGETFVITINNENTGHADASHIFAGLISHYSKATVLNNLISDISINAGATTQTQFTVQLDPSIPQGMTIPFYYRMKKGDYVVDDCFYVQIGRSIETFENQNFATFNWSQGQYPWQITTSEKYAGVASAKSTTNLGDKQSSTLQINVTLFDAGEVSYARKVSSEEDYDYFQFFIDDDMKESASGELNWEEMHFPIAAGNHTLKFVYKKDVSNSEGLDCAWIDNIVLPINHRLAPADSVVNFPDSLYIAPTSIVMPMPINAAETRLYPNPVTETVHIEIPEGLQISQCQLFDVFGRFIRTHSNNHNNSIEINVSSLVSGYYFVKIIDNQNKIFVKKFIKK